MTDYQERRQMIRQSLKIQPLSHGQVHTCLVGMAELPVISTDRREELRWSLETHNNNLIPIVVRRNEAIGEDKEYEVIHGAEWVVVAEDLGLETLWAWVFDLTDEQAIATREEMAILLAEFAEADRGGDDQPRNDRPSHASNDRSADPDVTAAITTTIASTVEAAVAASVRSSLETAIATQVEAAVTTALAQAATPSQSATAPTESLTDALVAIRDLSQSIDRLLGNLSQPVKDGATITLTIQPPPAPTPPPSLAEQDLRETYSNMTKTALGKLAKNRGLTLSKTATIEDYTEAFLAWHRDRQ